MDNIPVDAPPPVPVHATYQPQQQQQPPPAGPTASSSTTGGGGGLNFDENMKDIPQELAGQQKQQPQNTDGQSNFGSSTSNLNVYPSVLAPAPKPHHFSPAPGIPPNAAPQTLPALVPAPIVGPDGVLHQPPAKRPRGRPRKIPGVDSRPAQPRPEGQTAGRGRPKGSRGVRGRGRPRGSGMRGKGKRGRASSEEEDEEISVDETTDEEDGKKGKKDKDVDLNEEVDDDFGPEGKVGATTKFGRKISKPKSFVPTNKPTITRKKRQSTLATAFEANLVCQICHLGHSTPANALVICEACSKGYHQLCSIPNISEDIVSSDLPWFCQECDKKLSERTKERNVCEGEWTTGVGEDKGDAVVEEKKNELPVPPKPAGEGETAEGEKKDGEANATGSTSTEAEKVVDKEAEKAKPYSEEVKKEWLLSLPVNVLVGYVLSIEKKFAPSESSEAGLPIWPKDLPALLQKAKEERAAEAAERERRLEEEAEALAAAVAAADTPGGGNTETNSEAGTPLSFDLLPGETAGGGARTAASKRLQSEREAREAAQATVQLGKDQQQQQPAPRSSSSHTVPAYMRPAIPMASALGGGLNGSASPSGGAGGGDIQVGGPSSSTNGASNVAAAVIAQQQAQQAAAHAQAQAQANANRYAPYPSYSQNPPSSAYNVGGPGVGGYGFLSGSTNQGGSNPGGVAGAYQSPAPGSYANMYAQPPQQQQQQQHGGYPGSGSASPWGRSQGGN